MVAAVGKDGTIFLLPGDRKVVFPYIARLHGNAPKEFPIKVGVGEHHILVLTNFGNLFSGYLTTGGNVTGQQGRGKSSDTATLELLPPSAMHLSFYPGAAGVHNYKAARELLSEARHLPLDSITLSPIEWTDKKFVEIACGSEHSVVLDSVGVAYSFGSNEFLQCGLGEFSVASHIVDRPTAIAVSDVHRVYAKYYNTVLQTKDKQSGKSALFAFGLGINGQLGIGRFVHSSKKPERVSFFDKLAFFDESTKRSIPALIESVSIGNSFMGAVVRTPNSDDTFYLWGKNNFGQLGSAKAGSSSRPLSFILKTVKNASIHCGFSTTFIY